MESAEVIETPPRKPVPAAPPERCAPEGRRNAVAVGFVLFLVATAVTMAQYKIPTIMTDFMALFAVDAATASWSMSIFTFVGIIVALPTGFLAKRFGPRAMILAAVVLNAAAGVLGAFAPGIGLLLATRAVEGVALVFVVACSPLVIQACVDPAKNGVATGIYMLGGMLGATFAGVLTPTLYYGVGFAGLWVGYAVITVVAGAIFAAYIKLPAHPVDLAAARVAGDPSSPADRHIFLKANTWFFLVPFAIFQMVLLTVLSYGPTALQQQGMGPAQSGIVSTLPMMLAIVSSIAFGALSDRMGRCKPLCILGMAVLGPCCFVMLNLTGAPFWVALAVMGLLAMGTPTVFVAAYPTVLAKPELMSVGMGVLLLVQSLGQFLGTAVSSALLGPALDHWVLCGAVAMGLGLIGALCVALCRFR